MTYCWMCEVEHCEPVATYPDVYESQVCPNFVKMVEDVSRILMEPDPEEKP